MGSSELTKLTASYADSLIIYGADTSTEDELSSYEFTLDWS